MEFTEKYMIREAAKQVGVETHVLRYWEKELCLSIPKNEMGHRYYTGREIAFLRQIKYLKDQGFHLKSIRMLGEKLPSVAKLDMGRLHSLRDRLNGELSAETESYTEGHAAEIPTMISTKMPSKTPASLPKSMPENMPKTVPISSMSTDTSRGMTDTLRNAPAGTLANQQAARAQKKSVSGKTVAVVKGVPTGVSAGVSTGKTVGQKVVSATASGTISDRTPEEEALLRDLFGDLEEEKEERKKEEKKEEKNTLLELELAEPEKKEESTEKGRAFGVVQGGKSGALTETAFVGNVKTQAHEEEDGRMEQFRRIMSDIIGEALRENNRELAKSVGENVSDKVIKEMDFMLRTQQEEEEERYRKLDEAIRSCQRSRQETAAAQEGERRKLFGKRKI